MYGDFRVRDSFKQNIMCYLQIIIMIKLSKMLMRPRLTPQLEKERPMLAPRRQQASSNSKKTKILKERCQLSLSNHNLSAFQSPKNLIIELIRAWQQPQKTIGYLWAVQPNLQPLLSHECYFSILAPLQL